MNKSLKKTEISNIPVAVDKGVEMMRRGSGVAFDFRKTRPKNDLVTGTRKNAFALMEMLHIMEKSMDLGGARRGPVIVGQRASRLKT